MGFHNLLLSILMVINIVRTDEGQPRPKYVLNKCETNIYFFYSTDVWSITSSGCNDIIVYLPLIYLGDQVLRQCVLHPHRVYSSAISVFS